VVIEGEPFTVAAKSLIESLKHFDEGSVLSIETTDADTLVIHKEPSDVLYGLPVSKFANPTFNNNGGEFNISIGDFKKIADRAIVFSAKDSLRERFEGTFLQLGEKELTVTCTDAEIIYTDKCAIELVSKGMRTCDHELHDIGNVNLKTDTVKRMKDILSKTNVSIVNVKYDNYHAQITIGDYVIISQNILNGYPNFRTVFPLKDNLFAKVTVDKKVFLDAVESVDIFPKKTENQKNMFLGIHIENGGIKLHSEMLDEGKEKTGFFTDTVSYKSDRSGLMSYLSIHRLRDALEATDNGIIEFNFSGSKREVYIKQPSNPNLEILLMPLYRKD
jgi:DNA polymerase III sliding clamp (beta) subunit (PCNA family)